ncbi:hypothetical protein M5689_007598 [Euphorbia peplus]|nr:hypothetical protein M5689_007598 [Euphorbia peplus]
MGKNSGINGLVGSIIILVIVILSLSTWEVRAAGPSAAQCREERRLGVNACKPVVYGRKPSAQCCQRIRVTHTQCVCSVVTSKLAALIDLNRAIQVIQSCGRRVPRHFKCGSVTTP